MNRILVVDEGAMDRQIAVDILTAGLRAVEILHACNAQEAGQLLQGGPVDLLLVDIPYPSLPAEELIAGVREGTPGTAVMITAVMPEDELLRMAQKLEVSAYLLKPYRPAQLLAEVMRLLKTTAQAAAVAEEERQARCLEQLSEAIREYDYKKSVKLTKEYLDFLYDSSDNMAVIQARTVEYAEKMTKLEGLVDKDAAWRLSGCLARFRTRHDLQGTKYYSCSIFEEMLDIIFEGLDKDPLYSEETQRRVLNFIDRNVKRGVTLDVAAEYVNMSSCYFSKFFKKEFGVNFINYVTDRKIEYAKEMLQSTDMPVINIAYELSYNETGYFSKAFKKKVGITPTEFRGAVPLRKVAGG